MAPRKILAIKLRAMGDTVLATAPLVELRRAFPAAEIHALVLTPWAPLLTGMTAIQRIWTYERHSSPTARAQSLARLAYLLHREKFDCVVNFHASPSSSMLAFATRAPLRSIHFHGHKHKNRYSTVVVPGKGVLKPIIERDMDTVRALGVHVPAGRLPSLTLSEVERKAAQQHLSDTGMQGPVLGLGLGASRSTKSWSPQRYADLAIAWCQKKGGSVLAVAGPHEDDLADQFNQTVDQSLAVLAIASEAKAVLRNKIRVRCDFGIRELAAYISAFSVFVGNDSGPRHLAVALETPTVTLFGPEHPFEWHPYPTDRHPYFFIEPLACRKDADPGKPAWCAVDPCIAENHRCMRDIEPAAVFTECMRVAK